MLPFDPQALPMLSTPQIAAKHKSEPLVTVASDEHAPLPDFALVDVARPVASGHAISSPDELKGTVSSSQLILLCATLQRQQNDFGALLLDVQRKFSVLGSYLRDHHLSCFEEFFAPQPAADQNFMKKSGSKRDVIWVQWLRTSIATCVMFYVLEHEAELSVGFVPMIIADVSSARTASTQAAISTVLAKLFSKEGPVQIPSSLDLTLCVNLFDITRGFTSDDILLRDLLLSLCPSQPHKKA